MSHGCHRDCTPRAGRAPWARRLTPLWAGTQLLVSVPWFLLVGAPGVRARALLLGAGWLLNVAVAEWLVRRRPIAARLRLGAVV